MNRRTVIRVAAGALVVALALGAAVVLRQFVFRPTTIAALFTTATGVYPGDEVRVSGVKVGTIAAIQPEGTQTRLTLEVDRGVKVPADAKAVIVAPNLVASRYVQLTPAYRSSGPTLPDDAVIPLERTAVPVEWDEVKTQLMRLATDLGPQSGVSGTSVSRFIDSAANALEGNGPKLRDTINELSGVARILAEGSGNIVDIIKNLQLFVTALKNSDQQVVQFQNRLATLTSVVNGSSSDLDAAVKELSVAITEVQRFVAGTRNQTAEQVQRLANVTQNLVDNKMELQNFLHIAPNAFLNGYNIYNPSTGSPVGQFVLNNFSNPVQFVCGAIGAVENTTAPETAKLCSQYLGPALRLLNFNHLPFPIAPFLMPSASPEDIVYSEPGLMPGGAGGSPEPPDTAPALSAYNGGPPPPPPFTGRPPGTPPPGAQQMLPGAPPVVPPNVPSSLRDMLNPAGELPGPAPDAPLPAEAPLPAPEGTPPA
ncbi:MCE family protein [Mycolicibacterium cosmeticum]|uniref:Virulence factor mce family protein n=1 Tax=Mycolicibacterium cosmeticum TaxID=258533 RepID=W9BHK3_MYCCO|nr:MCE family protein [Mycolicibacterium cosmeticum]TLH66126.1 MCE family protein [Mycolicibacterium cosmeticum]CDO06100.1 virulence factor mce family protein [Mycolicibacterium cosmeticum]